MFSAPSSFSSLYSSSSTSSEHLNDQTPTHSFFPYLYDINRSPQFESSAQGFDSHDTENGTAPLNIISQGWSATTAMFNHSNKLFVFCGDFHHVDLSDDYCVDHSGGTHMANPDWESAVAACELKGEGYAVTASGDFWKINLETYEFTKMCLNLRGTTAIVAYRDYLLVFCDGLYKLSRDGSYQLVRDDLGPVVAAAVVDDYVFASTPNGVLYLVSLVDYSYSKISTGWERTTAIAGCNGHLYAFADHLFKVGVDGSWARVLEGCPGALAATAAEGAVYATFTTGDLLKIEV